MLLKGSKVWLVPERCWEDIEPLRCTLQDDLDLGGHVLERKVHVTIEGEPEVWLVDRDRVFINEHRCLEAIQIRLELAELHCADDLSVTAPFETDRNGLLHRENLRARNRLLSQRLLGRISETVRSVYSYDFVWETRGGCTYLAHEREPISTDPSIAALVDASNILVYGRKQTRSITEDDYPIRLWGRMGFEMDLNLNEFEAFRNEPGKVVRMMFNDDRIVPSGETYFPEDTEGYQNGRGYECTL